MKKYSLKYYLCLLDEVYNRMEYWSQELYDLRNDPNYSILENAISNANKRFDRYDELKTYLEKRILNKFERSSFLTIDERELDEKIEDILDEQLRILGANGYDVTDFHVLGNTCGANAKIRSLIHEITNTKPLYKDGPDENIEEDA